MANPLLSPSELPAVRGRYTANAALGAVGWFRAGGTADVLFKPADAEDLGQFMAQCPPDIPVTILGVLSNTIVRDGGVAGVVIRLGREFAQIEKRNENSIYAGAAALDLNVANFAADSGIDNLSFLSGVPGSIGGAIAMNAGAYGGETKDVMQYTDFITRQGELLRLTPSDLTMAYRYSAVPKDAIAIGAMFAGVNAAPDKIRAEMDAIKERRASTQPIRAQTGGSTFANPKPEELVKANLPEGTKSWQLVDKVGGRGLTIGGAQMSELHANFMINTGTATAADLENLGEEIRRRVMDNFGLDLHWEIKRIGRK